MKKISLYAAIGLALVTGVIGLAIGYSLTPEYQTSMYAKNTMNLGPADRTFDLRYVNAMIAHHRGAVLLAEQLRTRTERPEMKKLAEAILSDEPKAIADLYVWKKSWYGDTRSVRDPQVANLGAAGETFDLRFINALIAHHEAGILMTREARLKSSRAEVLDNCNAVEAFLSSGIEMLKKYRQDWYKL